MWHHHQQQRRQLCFDWCVRFLLGLTAYSVSDTLCCFLKVSDCSLKKLEHFEKQQIYIWMNSVLVNHIHCHVVWLVDIPSLHSPSCRRRCAVVSVKHVQNSTRSGGGVGLLRASCRCFMHGMLSKSLMWTEKHLYRDIRKCSLSCMKFLCLYFTKNHR